LDEVNIEIIRNTLYKSYLEDFYRFCESSLNEESFSYMKRILFLEADQRAISITLNSLGTDLNKIERLSLYPALGLLYPEEHLSLASIDEPEDIKPILARYPVNLLYYSCTVHQLFPHSLFFSSNIVKLWRWLFKIEIKVWIIISLNYK